MDVAWYLLLDDLTSKIVGRRVEAFPSRDEFVARHERTIGRPLEHLAWHEVFALARSIAVNDRQARIARSAGVDYPGLAGDDNPMLGVLRRRIDRYERG
jgi:aminoglycoside phosphotransferase (APT) family kinase protein